MSKNYEAAQNALDAFNEEPIFEQYPPEVLQDSYTRRLYFVHELEGLGNEEVERGRIPYHVAEMAVWAAIRWLEVTNEEKGCY